MFVAGIGIEQTKKSSVKAPTEILLKIKQHPTSLQ
jgi:hypothetical protein